MTIYKRLKSKVEKELTRRWSLMVFASWFNYHKAATKLAWFQDVESMLNDHLAGFLGLGSLSWTGHQVHVSLSINQFLNAGVDPTFS
ncbi:photosystem I P700 chlorophyll A apoprotein [Medicago truncatula]|uniref:Photosystem I P700 chlorophyll A apoprotein n=1 Tax=Medicago truncatula TaxID=3880 RepID=A0A072TXZ0_MEDTR|nr:photosystem I P700 chlorophyll A apoprotein [Medicago truncatula]